MIGVALAVLLAGGALTVMGQVAQFGRLQTAIARSNKLWLPVCLLGQLLAYAGYILAYHDAARADGGPKFSYRTTARVVVFGAGTSVLGATVGGLAVDYWALRRSGTKVHTAARRVLGVGTIEWTVLSLYAFGAAALALATGAHAPLGMTLAWLGVIPGCVLGALWFTAPGRVRRFTQPRRAPQPGGKGPMKRALRWVTGKAGDAFADAIAGVVFVRHLLSHPMRYKGGAIGYPVYWAGDMLSLYAAIRAFGVPMSPLPLILAYATSTVISSLPLPAGGAGGVEAAMAFALRGVGVPLAPALLGVFTYRIFTFWLPLLPTVFLLPSIRRLHERLPSIPHTPRDPDEDDSFRPVGEMAT